MDRDKTNLDILWLRDESLADFDNLPDPDIIANDIIENIEASLESFRKSWHKMAMQSKRCLASSQKCTGRQRVSVHFLWQPL